MHIAGMKGEHARAHVGHDTEPYGLNISLAPPRRTRPQIPVAILLVVVRSKAVAQEVEVLLPRIAHSSLRIVDGKAQPGHDLQSCKLAAFQLYPSHCRSEIGGIFFVTVAGRVGSAPSSCNRGLFAQFPSVEAATAPADWAGPRNRSP
jgi:hypothetical protein